MDYGHRRADGWRRREVLRVGALTALGLTLSDWFRLRARDAAEEGGARPRRRGTARACILIWLDGGPSHIDTFDPKPAAPSEIRGPFRSIPSRVPGVHVSELLECSALLADRFSIVRSVTSPLGEHDIASHYLLTGYRPAPVIEYPSFGSVFSSLSEARSILPPYIAAGEPPNAMAGPGYLRKSHAPFVVEGDPGSAGFRVRDLDLYPEVTEARLRRRRGYLRALDEFSRLAESEALAGAGSELERAYRLVTSPEAKRAFELGEEADSVRRRYGSKTIGASCLLARRLVERGVPFVTVTDRGWDTHQDQYARLKEGYTGGRAGKVPSLDMAYSALLGDLDERGLLQETLVVLMGEFGRTPKINTSGGRDHWPRVFSAVFAGGGVPGGRVIGKSDALGESPADRPVAPEDLARTIYTLLGIDPDRELVTPDGRPVALNKGGELVGELIG